MSSQRTRQGWGFRLVAFIQVAVFISSTFALPVKAYAQSVMELPAPGAMVSLSEAYVPVMLRAVKIHPDQPLVFDFIVDSGNTRASQAEIKKESEKLAKYFLASLTIPEKDLWVNLSPYEHDRIVPEAFGQTQMGRDLLAQDYVLKQISASLIYPENELGKEFWSRVYAQAREKLGTNEIPAGTFNKVWIMPDQAEVYELNNTAILGKSHLKVMMDEDYVALKASADDERFSHTVGQNVNAANKLSSQVMRQIVLPEIEKEVNTGKNFALLRQVYQALILATWYKNNLKESLLAQVYSDQNKIAGVDAADKADKEKIYARYIEAYKQGVFNYIKEETDPQTHEALPRKYFSGGTAFKYIAEKVKTRKVTASQLPPEAKRVVGDFSEVTVAVVNSDASEINKGAVNPAWDKMIAEKRTPTPEEDVTAYGNIVDGYWKGELKTTPYKSINIRSGDVNDAPMIDNMSDDEALRLERRALNFLNQGKFAASPLIAGSSSRMNVREAPEDARQMAGGKEIKSKAVVPVGIYDGKVVTYLDYFMRDFSSLKSAIKKAATEAGVPSNVDNNVELLFSNDEYLPEHVQSIRDNNAYGLGENNIEIFLQPLAPTMFARPADVEEQKKNLSPEAFAEMMRIAKNAEKAYNKGDLKALIVPGDRQAGGHGEYDNQLIATGKLVELYDRGIEVISVRNIDNLGGRFNNLFLRTLGMFLEKGLDFQAEVTRRAPGQRGGNLIVRTDTGSKVLIEDPMLNATVDANGQPIVTPSASYWLNSAVGLQTLHYVISLFKDPHQTDESFIEQLRNATTEERLTIAAKGRASSPVMFDPKPSKAPGFEKALTTKAGETNHWQFTTVVPDNIKMDAVGVKGIRDLPLDKLLSLSPEEQKKALDKVRFFSAKQWDMTPEKREEARKALEAEKGRPVSDQELNPILETYEGNKPYVAAFLDLVFNRPPIDKKMFDPAEDVKGAVSKKDRFQQGGIDFNPASLNLKVERTGKGIRVQVDPAEIQRIKAEGVAGFTPVIINIVPVKSMLPALGLAPAEVSGTAT